MKRRLVRTSQENRQLYKTLLDERKKDHKEVQEVLRHLVRGEDEAVVALLTANICPLNRLLKGMVRRKMIVREMQPSVYYLIYVENIDI